MNTATAGDKTSNPWVETDMAVHPSRYAPMDAQVTL